MKDTFVLDVDGEEVTCEVILGFTDDATGKEYIIYTDNSSDEDDQLNIYASQVDPEDADNILPIETEEEYAFVQEVLDSMMSEEELRLIGLTITLSLFFNDIWLSFSNLDTLFSYPVFMIE